MSATLKDYSDLGKTCAKRFHLKHLLPTTVRLSVDDKKTVILIMLVIIQIFV